MSHPFDLNEKRVLVTGASSGIGTQIARECAERGASLVISGRNQERLEAVASSLSGSEHQIFVGDLNDTETRDHCVASIPQLDGVVHCAGVSVLRPLKFIQQKDLDAVIKINLDTPVLLSALLLKKKKIHQSGSVVFVNSISSLVGTTGHLAYAVSKSGLLGAMRVMALELAPQKIRVNCVSPGIVRTPLIEELEVSVSAEKMAEREGLHPLGFGRVEDVAYAIIYLLSDASRWVTGSNLVIDGGYTIQ